MGGPSADYAAAITALADDRGGIQPNVYESPMPQIQTPAILVRPDDPWVNLEDDQTFGTWAEHYLAVCVASAGDPVSAKDQLRELVILARDAAELVLRSWRFVQASGIGAAEDSGNEVLTATVRVTHTMEE